VPYVLTIAASKEVANMRLILIDNNSGLIFGDTANYLLARLNDWRENNSDNNSDTARLSLMAARLLDDTIGEHGREYGFINYDPRDTRTGYLLYRADIDGADALPVVTDGQKQEMIHSVRSACRLEGFVECRRAPRQTRPHSLHSRIASPIL
jgi:hypothetical protein